MGYKILFLINPVLGHIQTTLEVVQELVNQGHEVIYYATKPYKQIIQNTGARFEPLNDPSFEFTKEKSDKFGKDLSGDQTKVLVWLLLWGIECNFSAIQIIKQLQSQKFDMVLYDDIPLSFNYQIAKKVNTKCHGRWFITQILSMKEGAPGFKIQSIPSYIQLLFTIIWMYITLLYLFVVHQFRFKSILAPLTIEENFNLVCVPKEFQQPLEIQAQGFTNDERFYFDGPFIREEDQQVQVNDFPFHQLTRAKTMYISLGSVSTNQEKIYYTFMEAYDHPYFEDWNIILNCDDTNKLKKRGQIPNNFIVQAFVPQIAVLRKSDFYVCHGGINSVMEAMKNNVPQLIIPQIPERQINAISVKSLGTGDYISQFCTAKELREKTIHLIQDEQISYKLDKFRHTLSEQSAKKATKHIIDYIRNNSS